MTSADEKWMGEAICLAHKAESLGEVPVGAVLVRDNEMIAAGFNQPISSSDPTAHAEIVALRSAARQQGNYRLPDTTLYVTIEPCTMCLGALIHARVSRLVFGAREPRAGAVVSCAIGVDEHGFNHHLQITEGVLAEQCGQLLRDFFRNRRQSEAQ